MFQRKTGIYIRLKCLASLSICAVFFYSCHTSKMAIDKDGFIQIFNGKNLNNWIGDSTYWHVENSSLVGIVYRRLTGYLGVHVHVDPPMRVAFCNRMSFSYAFTLMPLKVSGIRFFTQTYHGL
jgi:hypothetical protein